MISVLVISQVLPIKSHNGGSTQVRNLLITLKKRDILVDFVSYDLPKVDSRLSDEVKLFLNNHTRKYFIVPITEDFDSFTKKGKSILYLFSEHINHLIKSLSNNSYKCIFAEFISMGHYLHNFPDIPKIINIHELNFLRQIREGGLNYKPLDKFYLIFDAFKSLNHEIKILHKADLITSYNEIEIEILKIIMPKNNIAKIPLTIEIPSYIKPIDEREYDFVFIGNFEHKPNRDSIEFILENSKKILKKSRFLIGGRGINLLKNSNKFSDNIKIIEDIENPQEFLQKGKILLFPTLSGGGARVKIIEALANGNLVITTPLGAEGLEESIKKEIFILKKEEFISDIPYKILENIDKYKDRILQNRKLIETLHHIDASLKYRDLFLQL